VSDEEHVYVIGSPGTSMVKIGRTTNIANRLAAIQRMSPAHLAILWTHTGGCELETNLHRHFASRRSHGEWFDFGDEDPVQRVQEAVEARPWTKSIKEEHAPAEVFIPFLQPDDPGGNTSTIPWPSDEQETTRRNSQAAGDETLTADERAFFNHVLEAYGLYEAFRAESIAETFGMDVEHVEAMARKLVDRRHLGLYGYMGEIDTPVDQRAVLYGMWE
jgi:hypothetical protein